MNSHSIEKKSLMFILSITAVFLILCSPSLASHHGVSMIGNMSGVTGMSSTMGSTMGGMMMGGLMMGGYGGNMYGYGPGAYTATVPTNAAAMYGYSPLMYRTGFANPAYNIAAMYGNYGNGYGATNMYGMGNMDTYGDNCCGGGHMGGNMYWGYDTTDTPIVAVDIPNDAAYYGMPLANAIGPTGMPGYLSGLGSGTPSFTQTSNVAAGYWGPNFGTSSFFLPYGSVY